MGGAGGPPPSCACGMAAARRQTQKPGPNLGRWFWLCSRPQGPGRCPFFMWDSPPAGASSSPGPFSRKKRALGETRETWHRNREVHRNGAPSAPATGDEDALFEEALLAMALPTTSSRVGDAGPAAANLDRFAYGSESRDATWWEEASKRQRQEREEQRRSEEAARQQKPVKVSMSIIGATEIGVKFAMHSGASSACSRMGGRWDRAEQQWVVPLEKHTALVQSLGLVNPRIHVDPVPQNTLRAMEVAAAREASLLEEGHDDSEEVEKHRIPRWADLYPFQQEGVRFGIGRGGRCMIADEMGLGKTVQGISLALQYRLEDWPCLVICPSSLRFNWKVMFEGWAGDVEVEVTVLMSTKAAEVPNLGGSTPTGKRRRSVVVATYDMLSRGDGVRNALLACDFNCVVLDESHCIKNASSNRTRSALQLLGNARRRVLLSGTPALSRPIELFTQLSALAPEVFGKEAEFGERYCGGGSRNHFSKAIQYTGASNLKELNILLERTVMVRRKKSEVLKELPDKTRTRVTLPPPSQSALRALAKLRQAMDKASAQAAACSSRGDTAGAARFDSERQGLFGALYTESAEAKATAAVEYISTLLEADPESKLIVFAHHKQLLDAIENGGKEAKVASIRIDGATAPQDRHSLVAKFQDEPETRLAVLSITAAGVGLTLTAASVVVFAELYYNPSSLIQAEDRAHRIGQRSAVSVRYLISPGTIDEMMWRMVERKLRNVGMAVDGADTKLGAKNAAKPQDKPKEQPMETKKGADEWWVEGFSPTDENHSGFQVGQGSKSTPLAP